MVAEVAPAPTQTPETPVAEDARAVAPSESVAPAEETPATEREFDSPASFLESLDAAPADQAAPEPPARRSPLDDPQASQRNEWLRTRTAGRQAELEAATNKLRDYGLSEEATELYRLQVKGLLNAQHSDDLQAGHYPAAAQVLEVEQAAIRTGFEQALNQTQLRALDVRIAALGAANTDRPGIATYADVFKGIVEIARDGYYTKKQRDDAVEAAWTAATKQAEKAAAAGKSEPSAARSRGPAAPSKDEPQSWQEVEQMVAGMHPSGRELTNTEARAYAKKFGVRVPGG